MVLVLCTNMAHLFWQIFIYSSLPINMYNSESNQQLIINENNCQRQTEGKHESVLALIINIKILYKKI